MGRRLGSLTTARPKALVEVAGRPLVGYASRFARAVGADRLVVVGGFFFAEVAACVRAIDPAVEVAENRHYARGSILSLRVGMEALGAVPTGLLLLNTDHIYRPSIAGAVAAAARDASEVTAFVDRDRTLGPDDMKIALDPRGRVAAISKTLPAWDAGYVGLTYVPAARWGRYRDTVFAVLDAHGEDCPVEDVMGLLARGDEAPVVADISGHGWLEVDEPHERDRAEAVLEHERWYG